MKKGKKLIILLMASVLALSACGNDNISNTEEESHEEESYVSDSYESESYEANGGGKCHCNVEAAPRSKRRLVLVGSFRRRCVQMALEADV